jgi:UDP-glucuronate 4-epimerase
MILVTGGAGFIGSHVCERLLKNGHPIAIVDDCNDFYPPQFKEANLAEIRTQGRVIFYKRDICDAEGMNQIFQQHRPEVVIHLAARAGVRPSLEEPLLYERVNIGGTLVLLEAARRTKVRKFVLASSSSVYGIANRVPFSEADLSMQPISPYAATKLSAEHICHTYSHLYRLPVSALRFFTVYGPRQRPDLAIRKFTQMIDEGRPVPVFGDGTSGRDYTYVEDTVNGILAAMEHDHLFEVFNLGNSHPVPLAHMIATIEQTLGKRANIRRLPDQPGDVPITYADISKANRLLGYAPQIPFEDGIRRFAGWYSRIRSAATDPSPAVHLPLQSGPSARRS